MAETEAETALMTEEIDINQLARHLSGEHGGEALNFATMQADKCLEKNDFDGERTWLRVIDAIKVLLDRQARFTWEKGDFTILVGGSYEMTSNDGSRPSFRFPEGLQPTSVYPITLPGGRTVEVSKATPKFQIWKGGGIDTYGGKAILVVDDEPVFAELAILRTLQRDGWDGVWIDTYRNKFRRGLPEMSEPVDLTGTPLEFYDKLKAANGRTSGFWDVFAWKNREFVFCEAKRAKKDQITSTQKRWLEVALSEQLDLRSFLVVEWDTNDL